jgi:Family of unknown function (DUF5343)
VVTDFEQSETAVAETSLPYINAPGYITKVLNKIKEAETPSRFSQDFLGTTLQMPGGSPRPVIPFLKRTGFLASDGTPTELYKRFRGAHSGAAAAEALRTGYRPLYRINEFAHDAPDPKLKELIVQATGAEKGSKRVGATAASFNALKAFADFSSNASRADVDASEGENGDRGIPLTPETLGAIRLGYTINLNLPATSEVAVFDAIFRSLKEHLLR